MFAVTFLVPAADEWETPERDFNEKFSNFSDAYMHSQRGGKPSSMPLCILKCLLLKWLWLQFGWEGSYHIHMIDKIGKDQ